MKDLVTIMSFGKHNTVLDNLKTLENEIVKNNIELPDFWIVHSKAQEKISLICTQITQNIDEIKRSDMGKVEKRISKRFTYLIEKIEHVTKDTLDKFIVTQDHTIDLQNHIKTSMATISKIIHELLLETQLYPINEFKHKPMWRTIQTGLIEGSLLPPDIDYINAKKIISHFINEELLCVLQYNTTEKPYLFVTKDNNVIKKHIVKLGKLHSGSVFGTQLTICKIMEKLGMKSMQIDRKHKLVNNKIQMLNKITYIEGVRLDTIGTFSTEKEIIAFSYYLGAASADAFILNLSDRPDNLHIDFKRFTNLAFKRNYETFIGDSNPIFNIDYEMYSENDPELFISSQLFGTYGIVPTLFYRRYKEKKAIDIKEKIIESFNKGFTAEFSRVVHLYSKNKSQINYYLARIGKQQLVSRFHKDGLELLKEIQEKEIKKFI